MPLIFLTILGIEYQVKESNVLKKNVVGGEALLTLVTGNVKHPVSEQYTIRFTKKRQNATATVLYQML